MKRKCAPGFVAVQPVQFACGHRYHEVNEEVFYIIRGHAAVRTPEGEKNLKEGDAIVRRERTLSAADKLVYLDVGIRFMPDVMHFPDTVSRMVCSSSGVYHFRESWAASLFRGAAPGFFPVAPCLRAVPAEGDA